MCYNVFMANTIHVTLRMPIELATELAAEAKEDGRSLSQVIVRRLTHGRVAKRQTRPHRAVDGQSEILDTQTLRKHHPVVSSTAPPTNSEWKHNKANCHVYGCLMCKESDGH